MINDMIHRYNNKDSLYGDKLTNHLNMGLYALYRMKASEQVLDAYAHNYIEYNQLQDIPAVREVITDENFHDFLGLDGYYSSFVAFFENKCREEKVDTVFEFYLNQFIDGSAGGAFHGLIRLAYAYELQDQEEMIKSLAYMAECYKVFPIAREMLEQAPTIEPMKAILALSTNSHFKNKVFSRNLIIGRMEDVSEDPVFKDVYSTIPISYCNSQYFGELLLKLYALTEDFTMLHGFTSTHALRVLSPLIKDYQKVLNLHWFNLQLAYLSTNCTTINEVPFVTSLMSWEEIFEKTIQVKDVHTIKLIYSLYEQSKFSKVDSLHRTLAQRKVSFN